MKQIVDTCQVAKSPFAEGSLMYNVISTVEDVATGTLGRGLAATTGLGIYSDPLCMEKWYAEKPENKTRCAELVKQSDEEYRKQFDEDQKMKKEGVLSNVSFYMKTGRMFYASSLVNAGGQICTIIIK